MSGSIPSFSDKVRESDGKSAFEDLVGDGATPTTGPPTTSVQETLFFDFDARTLYWFNSNDVLCSIELIDGDRFLLEDFGGRIILEDGSGFLRD